jgi:Zn-dependent protease
LAFEISKAFVAFLAMAVAINLILAIFNMIPLGPLDGHRILAYWLPPRQKQAYNRFNKQYGMAVLFGLIMIGFLVPQFDLLYVIIIEPAEFIGELISGVEPLRMVYDILFPRG